jgi:hypothetical protein
VEDGPLGLYAFVPAEGVVASGHPVDIRLEVHNAGNAAVSFSFATAQRYDVVIWGDECKEVWRSSADRRLRSAGGVSWKGTVGRAGGAAAADVCRAVATGSARRST